MAREGANVAEAQNLPREQFENQLYQLFQAYSSLLHGTNSGSDQKEFKHWYNHFPDVRLGKKLGLPALSHELLSGAAYEYLNGALRVPKMDRALVDVLIAQETFAYIDRQVGWRHQAFQFGCFGVLIFSGIAWQVLTGEVNWHRLAIGLGIFAALVAVPYFWPRRGTLKLYAAMRDTYQLLSGSVVSVPEVRRAVERARDKGVVWPAELYAVLDDVEVRTHRL